MSEYWRIFWTVMLGGGATVCLAIMASTIQEYFADGIEDWEDLLASLVAFGIPCAGLAFAIATGIGLWHLA